MNQGVRTIDEYIHTFPKDVAMRLKKIREIVRKTGPNAKEVISYHMPAFKLNGMLLYFAAFQHHIGFYPFSSAIKALKRELVGYKTAKGSIQFPLNKPLPLALIRKIVMFRVKENLAKRKGF